jgi:hypothetical protein
VKLCDVKWHVLSMRLGAAQQWWCA